MLLRALAVVCALVGAPFGAVAQDFGPAIEQINKFRARSGEYRIVFTDEGFVVDSLDVAREGQSDGSKGGKHRVFTIGDKGEPVRLIQQTLRDRGLLSSKLDGTFGPATKSAVETFQSLVGLEEDGQVGRATWEALELPSLASTESPVSKPSKPSAATVRFESSAWPNLLSELTQHGLVEYRIDVGAEGPVVVLSFTQGVSDQAWQPNGGISISDLALETLRLAEQFPPRPSKDGRFVVLVHEPHSDVAGHFQLIRGLDALVGANADRKFKFLVEGEFSSEADREINASPTAALLSADSGIRALQVHYLVRNFLIDSPLAYRLLYKDIPSRAIDHFKVGDASLADVDTAIDKLNSVFAKHSLDLAVRRFRPPGEEKVKINRSAPLELRYAMEAEGRSSRVKQLMDAVQAQIPGQFPDIEKVLIEAKGVFDADAESWRFAHVRSIKMVEGINDHFKGVDASLLPIAFIGSGHTGTMLSKLPGDVGYVVLEPRFMRMAANPRAENARFETALHSYKKAIAQARKDARKQIVAPPDWAIRELRVDMQRIEASSQARLPVPPGPFDPEFITRLRLAVDRNPFLERAEIEIAGAGGGSPPPNSPYSRAFARYSPDSGPHGRLSLLRDSSGKEGEPATTGWNNSERFSYLERVLVTKDEARTSKRALFSLDPVSKRPFAALYIPEDKAYYFFDMSDKMAIQMAFAQPLKARELHQRVTEILLRALGERSIS